MVSYRNDRWLVTIRNPWVLINIFGWPPIIRMFPMQEGITGTPKLWFKWFKDKWVNS